MVPKTCKQKSDMFFFQVTAKEAAFFALGNDVFQLTFKSKRRDTLYFPNSLLAEGRSEAGEAVSLSQNERNYLVAAAALWELHLGQRDSVSFLFLSFTLLYFALLKTQGYLYIVILDADTAVDDWMTSWAHFLEFLMEWQPAVGLPEVYDYANVLSALVTV